MPYKSKAQERFMRGVAHGMRPSRVSNPPSQAEARKFVAHSDAASKQRSQASALRKRRHRHEP